MEKIGLYIHIPFCLSKCPYCDFYSFSGWNDDDADTYVAALIRAMERWSARADFCVDTVYFGGGTPALLGGKRLTKLLNAADRYFFVSSADTPEITIEANPADDLRSTLEAFVAAGGNRLSLGMQSAVSDELCRLGRRHTPEDVRRTVTDARHAGIRNLSLDMMLGISGQTRESALYSARTAVELGAEHISAYMLKIEPSTPYSATTLTFPEDDEVADIYSAVMETLDRAEYRQYEISNTAKPGFESRHNLKYWDGRPYLGLGPAASSYIGGRRFSYPRDIRAFMDGCEPMTEDDTRLLPGTPEEYGMLRLRLTQGIDRQEYAARFGAPFPEKWAERAARLPRELVTADEDGLRLTRAGFLLSNTLMEKILL